MKQKKKSKTKRVKYAMRLYVTGASVKSTAAITNLRKLFDEHFPGNYDLKVIDVYQQPKLARTAQIIAAPTLVKSLPLPLRRFIGDMSNKDTLLAGMEIHSAPASPSPRKRAE